MTVSGAASTAWGADFSHGLPDLHLTILVTGAAGFIGFHTSLALLGRGERVVGVNNLNDYYDVRLKEARLDRLRALPGFAFRRQLAA